MPLYPYVCPECGYSYTRFVRHPDQRNDVVLCEYCKSVMRRQPTVAAVDYWYGAAGLTRHKNGEPY